MVGLGEAGQAFVSGWAGAAGALKAYDLKAGDPEAGRRVIAFAKANDMPCFSEPAAALSGAKLALCLVTADQALRAAEACAPFLPSDLLWLDGNSCAPGTKRKSAAVIEAAGGRYVDMAIMASVHPRLSRTPALLAGPHAEAALTALGGLGMNLRVVGASVGDASNIKMLRSVMMKGLEALSAECLLAARRAGVEDEVLASLQASDPGWNWREHGTYNLERMLVHGARRAAEMHEVALALRDLGLPDRMAAATARWQAELGALELPADGDDLGARLDAILAALP
jgi:3-hydroxyisobutyrate dehydrogenase-like beta-hydroxyacid dehydrogenase